jgi:hypothetical protein
LIAENAISFVIQGSDSNEIASEIELCFKTFDNNLNNNVSINHCLLMPTKDKNIDLNYCSNFFTKINERVESSDLSFDL